MVISRMNILPTDGIARRVLSFMDDDHEVSNHGTTAGCDSHQSALVTRFGGGIGVSW